MSPIFIINKNDPNASIKRSAISWWTKQAFITKWELVVKHKELIIGYPTRQIDTLTSNEIESLYLKENK